MPQTRIEPQSLKLRAAEPRGLDIRRERNVEIPSLVSPVRRSFRRQAPIGNYIADFAWLSARIAIEVDGATHEREETRARDRRKDAFLRSQGFEVFRVNDDEVIANSARVFKQIEAAIRGHLKTPPPTPPHEGEGRRRASYLRYPSPQGKEGSRRRS